MEFEPNDRYVIQRKIRHPSIAVHLSHRQSLFLFSPFGGCIVIDFLRDVELTDMGLLDIEEEADITVS